MNEAVFLALVEEVEEDSETTKEENQSKYQAARPEYHWLEIEARITVRWIINFNPGFFCSNIKING
jgi:hypothetical protein